jgi:hypothetical protein
MVADEDSYIFFVITVMFLSVSFLIDNPKRQSIYFTLSITYFIEITPNLHV